MPIKFNFFDIIVSSFLVQNWGLYNNPMLNNAIWYISVLLFCYIIFYIICYLSKVLKFNEEYAFIMVIFVGLYIKNQDINFLIFNKELYRGYIAFFIGLFLRHLYNKYNVIQCNAILYNIAQALIISLIFFLSIKVPNLINQYYTYTFVLFPMILLLLVKNDYLFNILPISFLSKRVYYIYIWHPVFILLHQYFKVFPSFTHMLLLLVSLIFFSIIYFWFELNFIKRLIYKLKLIIMKNEK